MDSRFENIEVLIAKYLAGEADAADLVLLNEWRKLSSENEIEFSQMEKLYNNSSSLRNVIPVDTDAAWMKLKNTISIQPEQGKIISIKPATSRINFIRIAASILIVAGLGMLAFFLTLPSEDKFAEIKSENVIRKEKLPDGSTVTLNKNTTLAYSTDHFSRKRIVKLKGEAFFDVVHDEKNPFLIEAADLKIEDVGTSFNVQAKENTGIAIISVVSGEVKITTLTGQVFNLVAGEEATYNVKTKIVSKKESVEENISAYADRVFVFENAELKTVVDVLNDVYDSQLTIENHKLDSCRITVTFDNEAIDDIATVIAETLGLEIKKSNEQIILSGNDCK
ncbi:MAG: FecR domain-containing protein [Bacteroidetes bacterium]|nr:FecR domain-containing protein [Bacteroidota bacterium]MBP6428635.1 FecR domain-containing protein [Bacteroidia bacterium]